MKNYLLPFLILLVGCNVNAQTEPCGAMHYHEHLLEEHPELRERSQRAEERMYQLALSHAFEERDVVTIPIVFHIIHNNGLENIDDATVNAALLDLNQRMANEAPYYQPDGVNVPLRFCLASVDPFGAPTTGINRVVSTLTTVIYPTGIENTQALSRWNSSLYLNVWVVKDIQNYPPAFATLPSAAGILQDGIMIEAGMLTGFLLTHEVGHTFNLQHTFSGGCTNTNCLLDGDKVCDTPPDNTSDQNCGGNSCSTDANDTSDNNPFHIDVDDLPNYMDYNPCANSFTPGQAARMMNAYDEFRSTLGAGNGCGQQAGMPLPTATIVQSWQCYGTQLSVEGSNVVSADWDFNNDGRMDMSGLQVAPNVTASGSYHVVVYVYSYGGAIMLEEDITIHLAPYQNYPMINGFQGIGYSAVSNQMIYCFGQSVEAYGEPNMTNYQWANGATTQNINFTPNGEPITIALTATDANGLTWTSCYPINAVQAPPPIPPVISAEPNVPLCVGNPINIQVQPSPIANTLTFDYSGGSIFPFIGTSFNWTLNAFQWFSVTQVDLNGCTSQSNYVSLSAQDPMYGQPLIVNGLNVSYFNGVNIRWYRDNILLPQYNDVNTITMDETGCYKAYSWWASEECGAFSTDSACAEIINVQNASGESMWRAFPNPAKDELNIQGPLRGASHVSVWDVSGRKHAVSFVRSAEKLSLEIEHLAPGTYIVCIRDNAGHHYLKFLKE